MEGLAEDEHGECVEHVRGQCQDHRLDGHCQEIWALVIALTLTAASAASAVAASAASAVAASAASAAAAAARVVTAVCGQCFTRGPRRRL